MKASIIRQLLALKPELSIDEILTVVGVYRLMQEHRISENQAFDLLGTTKGRFRTCRDNVAREFGAIRLFASHEQGESARPLEDEETLAFIEHLECLIHGYAHLRAHRFPRPVISLGTSMELSRWFVPEVLRRFREMNPEAEFEVHVQQGTPSELRRRAFQEGILDIVLTSRDPDDGDAKDKEVSDAALLLRPYFLVDRRHPLADRAQVTWEMLRKNTIVMQKSHRLHFVSSKDLIQHLRGARILWADYYASAFAMTLASKEMCCLGFPQIMSPDRKARFYAIDMDSPLQIPFAVYTPERSIKRHARSHANLIRDLANVLRDEFKKLDPPLDMDLRHVLGREMRRTWNVTRRRDGQIVWQRGHLSHLVVTPDGYLRADHTIEPEAEQEVVFSISGQITRNRINREHYHILWRGWGRFDEAPPLECYAVSITATKEELQSRLIGHWLGRVTSSSTYHADFGYFLVVPLRGENDQPDYTQFKKWIEQYCLNPGCHRLQVEVPEKGSANNLGKSRKPLSGSEKHRNLSARKNKSRTRARR